MLAFTLLLALLQEPLPRPFAQLSVHELAARIPKAQDCTLEPPDWGVVLELERRIREGARPSIEDWKCMLLDRGWLRWRDRWPQSEPFAVGLHRFLRCDFTLELVPRLKDWKPARWGGIGGCTDGHLISEFEDYQVLGALTEPETSIELDLYERRFRRGTGTERGTDTQLPLPHNL